MKGKTMSRIAKIDLPDHQVNTGRDGATLSTSDNQSHVSQAPDPFADIDQFRLGQNFGEVVGVTKTLTTVPVRKPSRQDFIRVHPEADYRLETAVLEVKDDREVFLVDRALWPELMNEISPRVLFTCMNRQGVLFLWPVRRPGVDGRIDGWSSSALSAAQLAMQRWVRVAANMSLGGYDVFESIGELSQPEWPELDFSTILRIAFKERLISSYDHPALRRLRGEI
jgi:hypothetical protein